MGKEISYKSALSIKRWFWCSLASLSLGFFIAAAGADEPIQLRRHVDNIFAIDLPAYRWIFEHKHSVEAVPNGVSIYTRGSQIPITVGDEFPGQDSYEFMVRIRDDVEGNMGPLIIRTEYQSSFLNRLTTSRRSTYSFFSPQSAPVFRTHVRRNARNGVFLAVDAGNAPLGIRPLDPDGDPVQVTLLEIDYEVEGIKLVGGSGETIEQGKTLSAPEVSLLRMSGLSSETLHGNVRIGLVDIELLVEDQFGAGERGSVTFIGTKPFPRTFEAMNLVSKVLASEDASCEICSHVNLQEIEELDKRFAEFLKDFEADDLVWATIVFEDPDFADIWTNYNQANGGQVNSDLRGSVELSVVFVLSDDNRGDASKGVEAFAIRLDTGEFPAGKLGKNCTVASFPVEIALDRILTALPSDQAYVFEKMDSFKTTDRRSRTDGCGYYELHQRL